MAKECTVADLFTQAVSSLFLNPPAPHPRPQVWVGRHREGKATWQVLQCCSLWLLRVHWSDCPGIGTSSFSCEKARVTEPDCGPVLICLSLPFLLGADGSSCDGFWWCIATARCHREVSEGLSHCIYFKYLLNQCSSELLKILNTVRHTL